MKRSPRSRASALVLASLIVMVAGIAVVVNRQPHDSQQLQAVAAPTSSSSHAPTSTTAEPTTLDTTIPVETTPTTATADPHVGDPVQIRMTATDTAASCCGLYFLFGDGGNYSFGTSTTCSTLPPPGTVVQTFSHTWNEAGRWEFLSQAISSATDCSSNSNSAGIYGWITISE